MWQMSQSALLWCVLLLAKYFISTPTPQPVNQQTHIFTQFSKTALFYMSTVEMLLLAL